MRLSSFLLLAAMMIFNTGCDPIQDPWVEEGELEKERARSEHIQQQLVDRLHHGQSDR